MWSKVNIIVDGTDMSDPSNMAYPYKSFIETSLNHDKSAAQGNWLPEESFIADTPSEAPNATKDNKGWDARKAGLKGGGWREFYYPLRADLYSAIGVLPPGREVKIVLKRNSDAFIFHKFVDRTVPAPANPTSDTNTYKLEIDPDSLELEVERYDVDDSVFRAWQAISSNFEIKLKRNIIHNFDFAAGVKNMNVNSFLVNSNKLPKQVICCFVDKDAYYGDDTKNPFYFEHLSFTHAHLLIDNNIKEPPESMNTSKTSGRALRHFYRQMREIGLNTHTPTHPQFNSLSLSLGHNYQVGFNSPLTKESYYSNQFFLCWDRWVVDGMDHFIHFFLGLLPRTTTFMMRHQRRDQWPSN